MSLSLFLSLSCLSCVPRSQCHVAVEINSNSTYIYFNKSVLNERFFLVYAIHYQYPSLSNFICSLYLRTEERILVPMMKRRKIMMKSPPQEEALTMSLTMRRTRMMRLITTHLSSLFVIKNISPLKFIDPISTKYPIST